MYQLFMLRFFLSSTHNSNFTIFFIIYLAWNFPRNKADKLIKSLL